MSIRSRRATFVGGGADLKFASHAGALANTDIPITDIHKRDLLVFVMDDAFTDQTANASITSDGNIQTTNDTSALTLMVVWWSVD